MRAYVHMLCRISFGVALLFVASAPSFADTVPGTIEGQFQVDENGAAIYVIPLAVPPGTGDVAPNLSLIYNSRSRNGLLGLGWSLNGLSTISRCPQTFAQDGARAAVTYGTGDRLCLDGVRLVPVSGIYWASGTTYQPERQNWTRVVAQQDGSFTATQRDGTVLRYGATADSRILAQGSTSVRVWAMSSTSDRWGNTLTARYQSVSGQFFPVQIDYTSNAAGGLSAGRSVRFAYDTARPDAPTRYFGGAPIATTVRLNAISTFVVAGGETLVTKYVFTYQRSPTTGLSLLSSLAQCDASGNCYPPTTFAWQAGSNQLQAPSLLGSYAFGNVAIDSTWSDFNADGLLDLLVTETQSPYQQWVVLMTKNGLSPSPISLGGNPCAGGSLRWTDFNADGLTDLACTPNTGDFIHWVRLSMGTRLDQQIPLGAIQCINGTFTWADFNGDARSDLLCDAGPQHVARLSTGSALAAPITLTSFAPPGTNALWGDFNGDSMMDLILDQGVTPFGHWVLLSTGTSLQPPLNLGTIGNADTSINWVDVNGDGMMDLVADQQVPPFAHSASFSTGAGLAPALQIGRFPLSSDAKKLSFVWADYNEDGLADLLCCDELASSQGRSALLFDGRALGAPQPISSYTRSGASYGWHDINGDGLLDFIADDSSSTVNQHFAQIHAGSAPDLLTTFFNGIGGQTVVAYQPLTGDVYSEDPSFKFAYPVRAARAPMYVVSTKRATDGRLNLFTYAYQYAYVGSKTSLDGRGWLGFAQIKATDIQTRAAVTTTYRQDYPFTGSVSAQVTSDATSGATLQSVTGTYQATTPFPGVSQVLRSSETTTYVSGGSQYSRSTSYSYDAYGSPVIVDDQGDPDTPADDLSVCTVYNNINTASAYLLGFPADMVRGQQCTFTPPSTCSCSGTLDRTRLVYGAPPSYPLASELRYTAGDAWLTFSFEYDAFGNPVAVTTPDSGRTTFTYDSPFQTWVTKTTNALGHTTQAGWDARFGEQTVTTDENGVTRTKTLDSFGRVASFTAPDPASGQQKTIRRILRVLTGPVSAGGLIYVETRTREQWSVDDDSRWRWKREYKDALSRTYLTRQGRIDQARTIDTDRAFDNEAQTTGQSLPHFTGDPPQWTRFAYDQMGRVSAITNPDGSVTAVAHDIVPDPRPGAQGNLARVRRTMAAGTPVARTIARYLDPRGNLVRTLYPDGATVDFRLDPIGRLNVMTAPSNVTTTVAYDLLGRQVTVASSDTGTTTFTYGANGLASRQVFPSGASVSYAYDVTGRMIQRALSSGESITLEWDQPGYGSSIGQLTSATVARGGATTSKEESSYDILGRQNIRWTTLDGTRYQKQFTFDAADRVVASTYPDGSVVATAYTPEGFVGTIARGAGGQAPQTYVTYSGYDALGRAGSVAGRNGLTVGYQYTPYGRLVGQTIKTAGQTAADYAFQWNAAGDVVAILDAGGRPLWKYGYGPQGYLSSAIGPITDDVFAYAYDAAGNVIAKDGLTLSYSGQLLQGAQSAGQPFATFAYNDDGSLRTRTVGAQQTSFTYDAELRLLSSTSQGAATTFDYDYTGQRTLKADPAGIRTLYVFDDYEITLLADGTRLTTGYLDGPTGRIAAVTTGGSAPSQGASAPGGLVPGPNGPGIPAAGTFFFGADRLGSTAFVTDDSGKVITSISYKPFGDIYAAASYGQDSVRAKFIGKELDESTSLSYLDARYLDSLFARFITPDDRSLGGNDAAASALHRYSYGGNDPVGQVDRTGHFFIIDDIIEAIVAIEVAAEVAAEVAEVAATAAAVTAGVYGGGAAVNGSLNPGKWHWGAPQTWIGMIVGGVFGAFDAEAIGAVAEALGGELLGNVVASAVVIGSENSALTAIGGGNPAQIAESFLMGAATGGALEGVGSLFAEAPERLDTSLQPEEMESAPLARRDLADDEPKIESPRVRSDDANELCAASFVAGTLVSTPHGAVPIESLELGTRLWSFDVDGAASCIASVTGLRSHVVPRTVSIHAAGEAITTTPEHLIWLEGAGWTRADMLRPGDRLRLRGGSTVPVERIEGNERPARVYTIEVLGVADFFVGSQGVLVHNIVCGTVTTDASGRITQVDADIAKNDLYTGTGTTPNSRAYARSMGDPYDDAGHIIGRALGGSGSDVDNIFPQAPKINRGAFAQWEKQVREEIQSSGQATIQVQFKYKGTDTRPHAVTYYYTSPSMKVWKYMTFGN